MFAFGSGPCSFRRTIPQSNLVPGFTQARSHRGPEDTRSDDRYGLVPFHRGSLDLDPTSRPTGSPLDRVRRFEKRSPGTPPWVHGPRWALHTAGPVLSLSAGPPDGHTIGPLRVARPTPVSHSGVHHARAPDHQPWHLRGAAVRAPIHDVFAHLDLRPVGETNEDTPAAHNLPLTAQLLRATL